MCDFFYSFFFAQIWNRLFAYILQKLSFGFVELRNLRATARPMCVHNAKE